jgi:hypothetical protein
VLPFKGERILSPNPKYKETVLLVGFFGSTKINLRRHIDFLGEIGFDCVVFELKDAWYEMRPQMKNIWAEQVTLLLDEISGPKIIFSFSNPSSGAIKAIADRHAKDVKSLICDSGPTGRPWQAMLNYFTYVEPLKLLPMRLLAATFTSQFALKNFPQSVRADLEKIPQQFPVLSIRGWKDKIITTNMIELIFKGQEHLDLRILNLPLADHVTGLKDFAEDYKPAVHKFLSEFSKTI